MEKDPQEMIKRIVNNSLFVCCVVLAVLIVVGLSYPAIAQVTPPPPAGGNPCPGGEPCNPEVPISGIEWLLVVGGLFGFRKIYQKFRKD